MTRAVRLALACAGALAVAGASDEPLEPERAFRLSAYAVAGSPTSPPHVALHYEIEPGHYLYKDRFRISSADLPLGSPVLPEGAEKDDPFVGRARILKGSATLEVPLLGSVTPGMYVVKVTAQGCAEDRICYAPFTQGVSVALPPPEARRP